MAIAVQTPFRSRDARQLGRRLFRKQVLPFSTVRKDGRTHVFDRSYCEQLVDAFNARAFPQVPFVLVDPESNRHTEDPERWRGEVKGLELAPDGLDALIELSGDGAELIHENPRLAVSARIVEDESRADGRRIARAIKHVAGTLDPEIGSLRDWEPSDLSAPYGRTGVLDLSAATYVEDDANMTDAERERRALDDAFDAWRAGKPRGTVVLRAGEPVTDLSAPREQERRALHDAWDDMSAGRHRGPTIVRPSP